MDSGAPAGQPLNEYGEHMVIAYHLILTNYGFWLPNDPRGSWSEFVRSWEIFLAGGPATKIDSRRSVANARHDFQRREDAKNALRARQRFLAGNRRWQSASVSVTLLALAMPHPCLFHHAAPLSPRRRPSSVSD